MELQEEESTDNENPGISGAASSLSTSRASSYASKTPASQSLAGVMEQTSRHMHALGHAEGLVPAQWAALRFFSTARMPNNTAIALARYQGLAFGPVSRTVRTLISKELLQKAGSAGPGRSEAVELTMRGRELLTKDPLRLVAAVCDSLSEKERACLAHALTAITSAVAKRDRS